MTWLNTEQAAEHVGVSWPTLRAWMLDRQVPHVKMGRRWIIKSADLDAALARDAEIQAGAA